MFGKKKRRRRRSELRLGAESIKFETAATRPALSLSPVLKFWQLRGAKISGITVLAMLIWIFYIFFSQPAFFVYGASIKGNIALSAREIYIASGVDSQNVFWINPVEVANRIKSLPNIKAASVSVTLPAQVVIEVSERRPQLLWQTGDTVWWVDDEGTIVPPKADVEDMLRIIDDDKQPLEAGYQIDLSIIRGAQTLRMLAPDVSVIRHTRAHGLLVATPEGWPVYLGDGSEIKAKLVVLSAILPGLREEEIVPSYIDLRDPLRPVYRTVPPILLQQPRQPPRLPAQLPPPGPAAPPPTRP